MEPPPGIALLRAIGFFVMQEARVVRARAVPIESKVADPNSARVLG
jgi:hypothetical protein